MTTEYGRLKSADTRDYDRLGYWRDKAEGLACDLDSAIACMATLVWGRRTSEQIAVWLSVNYGLHDAVVKARAPLKEKADGP